MENYFPTHVTSIFVFNFNSFAFKKIIVGILNLTKHFFYRTKHVFLIYQEITFLVIGNIITLCETNTQYFFLYSCGQ